jgi:hypothetical protein
MHERFGELPTGTGAIIEIPAHTKQFTLTAENAGTLGAGVPSLDRAPRLLEHMTGTWRDDKLLTS